MTKAIFAMSAAILVAVPALAMQQGGSAARPKSERTAPTQPGELTLFDSLNYNGDYYVIDEPRTNIRTNWNIRSVGIHPGDRWQICARSRYREPCIVLDRSVHDASLIGVEGQIGSARPAPDGAGD